MFSLHLMKTSSVLLSQRLHIIELVFSYHSDRKLLLTSDGLSACPFSTSVIVY